jgi:putative ATP-dependent endonuclease of the OLD family
VVDVIRAVRIANYRSIEELVVRPSRLCALVGENNAGKSNILKALRTSLGKDWLSVRDFRQADIFRREGSRDVCIEIEFDPPPTYQAYARADATPVSVLRYTLTRYKKATATAREGDLRLVQEPLDLNREPINVLAEPPRKGQPHKYKRLANIPSEVKNQVPAIFIGADRRLAEQMPTARYSLLRRLLEDVLEGLHEAKIRKDGGEEVSAASVFQAKLDEALAVLRIDEFVTLENLLRRNALENLGYDPDTDEELFFVELGLREAWDFFKSMRLLVEDQGVAIDSLELGDGAQNALIVAIFRVYERLKKSGAVFLIEEPEIHLDPHKCRFFYETLRRVSENNQVIYTTHSPYFVTVPFFDEVRIVYRDGAGRTAVREPNVKVDDRTREKLIKELDPERNELFFARHVILVEGDTEKLAFPVYARRKGIDLNREGVSIVEVGGKKSLPLFVRIVQELGLPLTVVFDQDSRDFSPVEKEKEGDFNQRLLDLETAGIAVHMLERGYEGELREGFGEARYSKACERYPKVSKPIRARLIALDDEFEIPGFVAVILAPLLDTGANGAAAKPAHPTEEDSPTAE